MLRILKRLIACRERHSMPYTKPHESPRCLPDLSQSRFSMVLENYFAAELQAPARNTVGSGITGKHVTTIAIECETPKTGSWIPGGEARGRAVNILIWTA
jgi:hypothetical protein